MASPIENYLQQARRSRYALARRWRRLAQHSTAQRKRAKRADTFICAPLWGYCERFSIRLRLQKFLSFFETVYSTISPVSASNCSKKTSGPVSTSPTTSISSRNMCLAEHSCVNSGKLLFNQVFNLICDEFMLILGTISTSKVTIVQPGAQGTVHIEFSRR